MIEARIYSGVRVPVLIPWSSKQEAPLWNGQTPCILRLELGLAAEEAHVEMGRRSFQVKRKKDTETEVIKICFRAIGKVDVPGEFILKIYNISL